MMKEESKWKMEPAVLCVIFCVLCATSIFVVMNFPTRVCRHIVLSPSLSPSPLQFVCSDVKLVWLPWAHLSHIWHAWAQCIRLPSEYIYMYSFTLHSILYAVLLVSIFLIFLFLSSLQRDNNYYPYPLFQVKHISYQLIKAVKCKCVT